MSFNYPNKQFLEALESHKGIIHKIARAYCKDEDDRKDLVQEIVIRLWRSFHTYNSQYKLSTWIYRIALNVSISYYKSEKRRAQISDGMSEGIIYLASDTQPEEADSDIKRLHQCIAELREFDKALIILHLEGYDHQEISEILGMSTTNVSTKISRIKQKLRQRFQELKKYEK